MFSKLSVALEAVQPEIMKPVADAVKVDSTHTAPAGATSETSKSEITDKTVQDAGAPLPTTEVPEPPKGPNTSVPNSEKADAQDGEFGSSEDLELEMGEAMTSLESEVDAELAKLSELSDLQGVAEAQGGMTVALMDYGRRRGLFTSTTMTECALESFGTEDAQTMLAALEEEEGERTSGLAGRIMERISSMASKIGEKLGGAITGLKEMSKKGWTKIKDTATAHPYATMAAAVAAVAAVGGVIFACTKGINLKAIKSPEWVTNTYDTIANKIKAIKWPFGDIRTTRTARRLKVIVTRSKGGGKTMAAKAGGWTVDKAKALASAVSDNAEKAWKAAKEFFQGLPVGFKSMLAGTKRTGGRLLVGASPKKALAAGAARVHTSSNKYARQAGFTVDTMSSAHAVGGFAGIVAFSMSLGTVVTALISSVVWSTVKLVKSVFGTVVEHDAPTEV